MKALPWKQELLETNSANQRRPAWCYNSKHLLTFSLATKTLLFGKSLTAQHLQCLPFKI